MKKTAMVFCSFSIITISMPIFGAPGDVDLSFGSNGRSLIDLGSLESVSDATLDSQNRILVAGTIGGDVMLARIKKSGSIDQNFGEDYNGDGVLDGYFLYDLGGYDVATKVHTNEQDEIYLTGTSSSLGFNSLFGMKLDSTGQLDLNYASIWGLGGYNFLCPDSQGQTSLLDQDGQLLIAGDYFQPGVVKLGTYALLDPNGDQNTAWGCPTNNVSGGGLPMSIKGIHLLPSNLNTILTGSVGNSLFIYQAEAYLPFSPVNSYGNSGVVLIDPLIITGSPAAIFNYGGSTVYDHVGTSHFDKVVMAGSTLGDMVVFRYGTNGALDSSFATGGVKRVNFGGADFARSVVLDDSGYVIVAGESNGDVALARLKKSGAFDGVFGTSAAGRSVVSTPGTSSVKKVLINDQGKIIVVGNASLNNDIEIFRFLSR